MYLQGIRVEFVYEGHQVKVKVTGAKKVETTDLHIYILDALPPVHVVWNHVDTDKLTTAIRKWRNVYVELSQTQ